MNAARISDAELFRKDCLELAPFLVGKLLVTEKDGVRTALRITETEAYRGIEDTACHAHKGRTPRNSILWEEGGTVYVYLCYGMHSLMNIISGEKEQPQGVLIRACEGYDGPGKLTKKLSIDKSFNGESITESSRIFIEDDGCRPVIITKKRVGINYATEEYRDKLWRFCHRDKCSAK